MIRRARGFTIIELLVVVSVIGILATITLIGFNRYQADGRDSQRASQATIISEALEKYYDKHGEYPSCPTITASASSVLSDTFTGLEARTLVTPQDSSGEDNSIKCQDLTTSDPDLFAYVGDGSVACSTGNACLQYTLKYKEESTGTIKTITSRRTTNILTSGDVADLAATTYSFSRIDLTWSGIGGATSYNVQWHKDTADFTTPTGTTTSSSASKSVTGLSLGSLYFFRVQPATATTVGNWSNVASATTYTLDTPGNVAAVPNPSAPASELRLSWDSVTNATSYSVQYSTSSAVNGTTGDFTTSPTTLTTTSPYVLGSLSAGATRYFHVKAVAAGYTSGWSSAVHATTAVPAPTCLTATTSSATQIAVDWTACPVGIADNYTVEYSTNSDFSSSSTITGITATSKDVTGLSQGTTRYFRVYALVGSVSSDTASPTASATTTVNTPGAPGVAASQPGAVRTCAAGYWLKYPAQCPNNYYATGWITSASCPSGTSAVYQLSGRYNSPTTKYYSGATSASQWFLPAALSGYYTLWAGQYYCHGPNANSSWGPWSGEVRP
jgi:prepilin-type N-terminal cleavage/methylation domain-containing protein